MICVLISFCDFQEPKDTKHPQLRYEYMVYESIKKGTGFPNVRFFGTTEHYHVMIMDLLGQSLEGLFNLCSRKFSLKTILMLAIQLVKQTYPLAAFLTFIQIDRIEYLHGNSYIHRDISMFQWQNRPFSHIFLRA
jgi:serine/threonine protein kinase